MRISAVLNQDSGTLKSVDLEAYSALLKNCFQDAGHDLRCMVVPGSEVTNALEHEAGNVEVDTVIAGGGDGTVSTAAGICWSFGKALGVLPAGTMNLFARSLKVPLDLEMAAQALASGLTGPCDIATANGRPFVHQFSIGLQPSIVKKRADYGYRSRLEKVFSGARAAITAFRKPPSFPVQFVLDGERNDERLSFVAISNNPYGEGHMPYADRLDGGILGIYRAGVLTAGANVKLASDLLLGSWDTNLDLVVDTAHEALLTFPRVKRSAHASIDGELIPLDNEVMIKIHAGALTVLVPCPESE